MRKIRRIIPALLAVACLLNTVWPLESEAQTISLSPEQQRLINQLPPSQRDAAMRQLRQLSQQAANTVARSPTTTVAGQSAQSLESAAAVSSSDEEPRLEPLSVVILSATAEDVPSGSTDTIDRRLELVAQLQRGNPYTLDYLGQLPLPGINSVSLAGLNEEQAALRLKADPALRGIDIGLILLPLTSVGLDALEPFGYELFDRADNTSPDTYGVPVPADYVIGPGDSLRIQLSGGRSAEYELQVQRDGSIQMPEIGPLQVAGMAFDQMRNHIRQRVSDQLIGTQANVSMGQLRVVPVFLVGEVDEPGSYTVGSLSTITSVLAVAGGIAPNGSLRRIQLKRKGRVVSTLDAYDLLLRGDTSNDVRVQSGDVIFVPPVGTRISVIGEVKRPAIYEYRGAANVGDIIGLAGGLLPTALTSEIRIERTDPESGVLTIDSAVDSQGSSRVKVLDGDVLRVPAGTLITENSVKLLGNVQRPDSYQWRPGLRLSDLIPNSRVLKPGSDLHYVLIRRELQPNVGPSVLSADLAAAWQLKGGVVDLELQSRDTVYVFDLNVGRAQYVAPLIQELELRSSAGQPVPVASIGGSVNAAGRFPIEEGMRIADLVRAGGGLAQSAYSGEAELTRYTIDIDGSRATNIISVDLDAALRGEANANISLQSFDYLNIRETPNWRDEEFVEIVGEVEFPGSYPIRQGETLLSVIERAGGVTDLAFPKGSVYTREVLKQREREQIDVLANTLESDLATLSLSDPGQSEAMSIGQALLRQLRNSQPVGRLVINLDGALGGRDAENIIVRGGDILRVPQTLQDVTVLGEIQYATSHVYSPDLSREEYIRRSGGTTAKADIKRIYVVRANGEVVVNTRSRFFSRASGAEIEPGDTIVVPLDTDKVRPLTLWTNVTQILYNIAIAARVASGL